MRTNVLRTTNMVMPALIHLWVAGLELVAVVAEAKLAQVALEEVQEEGHSASTLLIILLQVN